MTDYKKPEVVKLGSLTELTLTLKQFGGSDGIFLQQSIGDPAPLGNVS